MSDSLRPHELQHTRLPCPPLFPRVYSDSCPLSQWCHPTISSSVTNPLRLLPSTFPSIRVFFQWVGSSYQVAKVLELQLQHQSFQWFPLGTTGLISMQSKGLSRVFSNTAVSKHQFFSTQPPLWSNSHICTWLWEKIQLWLDGPLLAKWCLFFLICCLGLSKLFF